MQLKAVYLVVIYILFLYECFIITVAYKQFDVEKYSLVRHQLQTLTNVGFDKCVKACKMERACVSVNYGDTGCCTLNDCGVEDEEDKVKSLVFTPVCSYQQIRPTEAAISKVGKLERNCWVGGGGQHVEVILFWLLLGELERKFEKEKVNRTQQTLFLSEQVSRL